MAVLVNSVIPYFQRDKQKRNFLSSRTIVLPVEFLRIPSHFRQEEELLKAANFTGYFLEREHRVKQGFACFKPTERETVV